MDVYVKSSVSAAHSDHVLNLKKHINTHISSHFVKVFDGISCMFRYANVHTSVSSKHVTVWCPVSGFG